jgi:hypothetical protein
MRFCELRTVTARFGVDDEVGVALAIERHVLGAMLADGAKTHLLEKAAQFLHVRRGVFDELETVCADRVVPEILCDVGHGSIPQKAI